MCNVRQSLMFIYDCRKKRCAVRLYLQLFVGGRMSYLRYLYLSAHSGVQHILCYVFLHLVYLMLPVSLCFSSSCVPNVASFSVFFFILCTLCCQFLCVFLHLVYLMLPVYLDCPFLISPSLSLTFIYIYIIRY